jgi:hypothetical protein
MAILGQVSLTAHRTYIYLDQSVKRQALANLDMLLAAPEPAPKASSEPN